MVEEKIFERSIVNIKENELMIVGKGEAQIAIISLKLLNRIENEFISKQKVKESIMNGENIFGLTKPFEESCGIFPTCEYAGLESEGGRCHRCGKNPNN